jgi:Txe/YoeB family toxin of toxin-antitoxin system
MSDTPYRIEITRRAQKDITSLTPKLKKKLREILTNRISANPFDGKKLVGDLKGCWSVRLTLKDRIVYAIDEENRIVYILRARTHFEALGDRAGPLRLEKVDELRIRGAQPLTQELLDQAREVGRA